MMISPAVSLYILTFCRVAIGLVFAASSISKALDIVRFRQTIHSFNILPGQLSDIAALLFLCGEFAVVVLMLIGGSLLTLGFSLAIFLLLLFCIALVSVLARRIHTSCNCFGTSARQVSGFDVWRNAGFILCALAGYAVLAWAKNTQVNLGLVEWVLTGLGAGVFVVIWIQLSEIVQLFRQG